MKKKNGNPLFRKIRRSLDLTQKEVADLLGKSPQWVSALECGILTLSFNDVIKLAELYNAHRICFLKKKKKKKIDYF